MSRLAQLGAVAARIQDLRQQACIRTDRHAWSTAALRGIAADRAAQLGSIPPPGWRCGAHIGASRSPSPPVTRWAAGTDKERASPPAAPHATRTPPSRSSVTQGPARRHRASEAQDGKARPPALPEHAGQLSHTGGHTQRAGNVNNIARTLLRDATVSRLQADDSDGAIRGASDFIEWMVQAALEGDAEAIPRNTKLQQNSNWRAWSRFCAAAEIDPWRPPLTPENGEREGVIWGAAFFFIYSHMKPKKGNYIKHGPRTGQLCPPKPQSALAILRGARREHIDRGIPVPPLTIATRRCKEVLRRYAEHIGPENIVPNRKAPMSRELIIAILSTAEGEPLLKDARQWTWGSAYGRSFRALIHVLAQTGFRKAEISLATKETWGSMHLSFANLTWIVKGEHHAHLNIAQLFSLEGGDHAVIRPPPSKADPFGLRWGNNPIYLPYNEESAINAARALAQWEMCAAVLPSQRRQTPLFCGTEGTGTPLREATVTEHMYRLIRWCVQDDEKARMYSLHSFRSYLCSALMASGRTDAEIQLALRWASDDALRIYKVANVETYASWLLEAEQQRLTGVRAISLPRPLPEHDHLDRAQELLTAGQHLQHLAAEQTTTMDWPTAAPDYELDHT